MQEVSVQERPIVTATHDTDSGVKRVDAKRPDGARRQETMASRPRARRYHPAMGRLLFCFASSPPLLFAADEEGFHVVAAQHSLSTAIESDGNQQGGHLDFCSAGLKLASKLKCPSSMFRDKGKCTSRANARIVHSKRPQPRPNDRAIIIRQRTPYHTCNETPCRVHPRSTQATRSDTYIPVTFDVLLFKVSLQIRHT